SVASSDAESAAWNASWTAAVEEAGGTEGPAWLAARARQADLLREIFGNPHRPVTVNPAWLAWNGGAVLKVARAIYDGSKLEDLPVLADALEEAGCTDAEILAHCRRKGGHVRGCWVLDLFRGEAGPVRSRSR